MNPTEAASTARSTTRNSETRGHIRGSSLLLVGRLFALLTNFLVQVLTVRYLTKSDYGAFAYALSIVSMGASVSLLGLNRAVNRFVPIYDEERDYNSMFGTLVLALGSVVGFGAVLVVLAFGLEGLLRRSVVNDPLAVGLLLTLIALSPTQALDNMFQGILAIFAGARAIFFRRHILGPSLKLAAVLLVIVLRGSVQLLAVCYLVAGLLGLAVYVSMFYKVLRRKGYLAHLNLRTIRLPVKKIYGFGLPLLTTDAFLVLKTTMAVVLLESFRDTISVAEFRAVVPVAGLNLVVLQSLKLLFTPLASRLYVRRDTAGLNHLYWQSAVWITVLTFPVFAVCFFLADWVTVLFFGNRYAEAGTILAILAVGQYINAAMGLNTYTLQVYAKVRFIAFMSLVAVAVGLGLNLWLIPAYGSLGAAVATSAAIVFYNLLNHLGLLLGTGIDLFQSRYLRVYFHMAACFLGVLIVRWVFDPGVPILVVLVAVGSTLLLRLNREILDMAGTFPELNRVPVLRTLLGRTEGR